MLLLELEKFVDLILLRQTYFGSLLNLPEFYILILSAYHFVDFTDSLGFLVFDHLGDDLFAVILFLLKFGLLHRQLGLYVTDLLLKFLDLVDLSVEVVPVGRCIDEQAR